MPQVDFLAFATGAGANVQTQSAYNTDPERTSGYASGTAVSSHCNKAWRQGAFFSAVLANFIANQTGLDVLDDGSVSGKITQFQNAVLALTAIYAPLASPALTGSPTAPTQATSDNSTKIASTAFVKSVLLGYALLASPAFTGTPTAPTPTAADNSTKIATTAFVTAALSGYAKLASPAFSGVPTGPTASSGTNTTQLATTAFVQTAVSGAGIAFADQAAMEAATATNLIVSPGRLLYYPGAAKAWVACTISGGVLTVNRSYNCTASRTALGVFHITFQNFTFSDTNYVCDPHASTNASGGGDDSTVRVAATYNRTTNGCDVKVQTAGGGLNDPAILFVTAYGDV